MNWLYVLGALAGAFGVLFVAGFLIKPPDPVVTLTKLYVKLMRLGPEQGRVHLSLQLDKVASKFPGQSRQWYLEKLVRELQRAKNR